MVLLSKAAAALGCATAGALTALVALPPVHSTVGRYPGPGPGPGPGQGPVWAETPRAVSQQIRNGAGGEREDPVAARMLRELDAAEARARTGPSAQNEHEHPLVQRRRAAAAAAGQEKRVSLVDVAGDGHCLFSCATIVMREIGKKASVAALREHVAASVDEDRLQALLSIYTGAVKEKQRQLLRDYGFMGGVRSLQDLRAVMKTSAYFGDEMALDALEALSGVRLLVISTDAGQRMAFEHRLRDEGRDEEARRRRLEKENVRPERFAVLVLDRTRQHYMLVRVHGKAVLAREELPPRLRAHVDNQ
jgi:hypothetical protein